MKKKPNNNNYKIFLTENRRTLTHNTENQTFTFKRKTSRWETIEIFNLSPAYEFPQISFNWNKKLKGFIDNLGLLYYVALTMSH